MSVNCVVQQTLHVSDQTRKVRLTEPLYYNNQYAHAIRVLCLNDDDSEADLTGVTCEADFVRPDGGTVHWPGTVSGSQAEVVLPKSCYLAVGRFKLTMQIVQADESKTAIRTAVSVDGVVERNQTDTIIDPAHVIPSLDEVIQKVAECDAATEAANAAAEYAMGTATGRVRYDEEQELSEDEMVQARENIEAEDMSAVPIKTSNPDFTAGGYVYTEDSGTTAVEMTQDDPPKPALTANQYGIALVRATQAGDVYTIYGRNPGTHCRCCMFVDSVGNILGSYASPTDFTVITAPANTAWIVFHKWAVGSGKSNTIAVGALTKARLDSLDAAIVAEAGLRDAGDASTLTAAKNYADGAVGAEAYDRQSADADTLASARTYADGAVANRVRFDESQDLDTTQKATARSNIGAVAVTISGTTLIIE